MYYLIRFSAYLWNRNYNEFMEVKPPMDTFEIKEVGIASLAIG